MKKTSGLLWALILSFATASCGGSTGPGGGGGGGGGGVGGGGGGGLCAANTFCTTVSNTFSPNALTVTHGTTVTWDNSSGGVHNVVWNDAAGKNAALAGDGTGDIGSFDTPTHTRLFNTPGVYGFKCSIHPATMTGTLTVQ